VVINEILADNRTGLRDEDGTAADWLELHNRSSIPVPLAGAFLTDAMDEPQKWPLPAVVLPPQGYLVIFASGKDRRDPQGQLHTNFSLSKQGEYLAMTSQGQVVSGFVPAFPSQSEDVSYGFSASDSTNLIFMPQPTPGAANNASSAQPDGVRIDPPNGTFTGSMAITLSTPATGAVIHFTLDGTVPTVASPVYTQPIPVSATTQVRARARVNESNSAVTGASWIRLSPALATYRSALPLMVIENFNRGPVPAKGLTNQQVAMQSAVWQIQERSGGTAGWDGLPQLSGDIGIRGRGHFSSTWSKPPFAVECQAPDGETVEGAPLGLPSNDDWVLYYPDPAEFRDPTMLANTFIYELSRRLGRYAPRFRFVELFLNTNGGDLTLADRQGVYVLLEKISRGAQRLDFENLSADGTRGGALLSINRPDAIPETGFPAANGATTPQFFRTAGPDRILQTTPDVLTLSGDDLPGNSSAALGFEQPGGYRISPAQRTALETWFRQFEDALYHPQDWRDPVSGWRKWLVEDDWAQGYLLQNFTRHFDALRLSVYPWLGDDRKLRLGPIWDVTPDGFSGGEAPDESLYYRSGQLWFPRLFADPDFKQTYLDQWTRWRRTGFSDAAMESVIETQAAEITAANAVAQGIPSGANWEARITVMKGWVKARAAFFDQNFVPLPIISQPDGIVANGTTVGISSPAPEWWVTTDGSDPRLPGGAVSPMALANPVSVVINQDTKITARSRQGSEWSGPVTAVYAVGAEPANAANLLISEIHYQPAAPTAAEAAAGFLKREDFAFLELYHPGPGKVSLHDVQLILNEEAFSPAWEGAAAPQWTLPPGGRLVLAANQAAFIHRHGATAGIPGGTYQNSLEDAQGVILLKRKDGSLISSLEYGTRGLWPAAANGAGYSLTLREGAPPSSPASWRSSVAIHGTPGSSDATPWTGISDDAWRIYALGQQPDLTLTGTTNTRQLSLTIPPGADRAQYQVETSRDLQAWQQALWTGPVESRTFSGKFTLTWTSPDTTSRFLRIRAVAR
jgi:hypothetical protein